MDQLTPDERLRLMRFVCSFAWTDLKITDEERALVRRMVDHFGFGQVERSSVARWLEVPPPPEEVDPDDVPRAHRFLFLEAARSMIEADGRVAPGERESLEIFAQLVG